MPEQSDYQEAREAIAQTIGEDHWKDSFNGDYVTEHDRELMRKLAGRILALTYSDGSPMIGVLAKDQTVPENPYFNRHRFDITESAFTEGQQSLANFRRIAKEE